MPSKKKELGYYLANIRNYSVKLPWKIFTKILVDHYGCEMISKRGSARLFVKGSIRFSAHEPHGRESYVSKFDRQRAIKYLVDIIDPQ